MHLSTGLPKAVRRSVSIQAAIVFTLTVMSILSLAATAFAGFSPWSLSISSAPAAAERGAVASMDARCSQAGIDMFGLGGNAADAVRFSLLPSLCTICPLRLGERTPIVLHKQPNTRSTANMTVIVCRLSRPNFVLVSLVREHFHTPILLTDPSREN